MIVLIDNYDSFSYNVYQLIGSVEPDIKVVRNDEYTVKEIEAMRPEALIISPGPGKPSDAGICIEAIRYFVGRLPILGICLGHQAICEAFGGEVSYAKELMHGKKKTIYTVGKSRIFEGLGDSFQAARYHSLAALKDKLPDVLKVTAEAEDGEVYLYRYTEINGTPDIQNIESDEEYEIVADAFDELLDTEEYDEIVGEDELDD